VVLLEILLVDFGFRRGWVAGNTALNMFDGMFMVQPFVVKPCIDGSNAKQPKQSVALARSIFGVYRLCPELYFAVANSNDSLRVLHRAFLLPYNFAAPQYRPATGSPALTISAFNDAGLFIYCSRGVAAVNYRGALLHNHCAWWTDGRGWV